MMMIEDTKSIARKTTHIKPSHFSYNIIIILCCIPKMSDEVDTNEELLMEECNDDENDDLPLCTFAVTGAKAHFQGIYLCHTCSKSNNVVGNDDGDDDDQQAMPLCICYSCAEICHESKGHEVEFVGDGPAYCDCISFSAASDLEGVSSSPPLPVGCICELQQKSWEAAVNLNIRNQDGSICCDLGMNVEPAKTENEKEFPFVCDVFDIPQLRPCDRLVEQALELIKHTRDTHWISLKSMLDEKDRCDFSQFDELCELEILACSIFLRHVEAYKFKTEEDNLKVNDIGAEWWVQVKEIDELIESDIENKTFEAIDLHYDKDEELAASFDIGSFPTMSTVTYLTDGTFGKYDGDYVSAPPTLVFAHTHEMLNRGPLGRTLLDDFKQKSPQLVISHAREGKHLCFDGRLLHGAAANIGLRQKVCRGNKTSRLSHKGGLRVTFLVNIWMTRRPSRVTILSEHIRTVLKAVSGSHDEVLSRSTFIPRCIIPMYQRDVHFCNINQKDINRIKLPFVSKSATWINDENPEGKETTMNDSGLVVSIIPPPPLDHEFDTVLVSFEETLEPELQYIDDDD